MRRLPAFPGFPLGSERRSRTHFGFLARSIVFQQLHVKAATTIHDRVCALTPGPAFPEPRQLLGLPDRALRGAGLSANKLAALRDLARRVEAGALDLARIARGEDEEIVERLVEVRGIGRWTAQMFLLFRLGRPDVMAETDLGVREGIRILDGLSERPAPQAALERAALWAPLRSVGCWTMWRLVESTRA